MTYTIYKARSRTSGGEYIGITSRQFYVRQREHRYSITSTKKLLCKAFVLAMQKYGYEDFEWYILLEGLESHEAFQMEKFLINFYRPRYNLTLGGEGTLGVQARPVVCINTGKVYPSGSAAATEHGVDPNRIVQLCSRGGATMSGLRFRYADSAEVIPPQRDPALIEAGRRSRIEKLRARRHSPETIERMRAAAKVRGMSAKAREVGDAMKRKPLVCIETGTVFKDASEAALAHGVTRGHIYGCIKYNRPSGIAGVSFRHALPHEVGMGNVRG